MAEKKQAELDEQTVVQLSNDALNMAPASEDAFYVDYEIDSDDEKDLVGSLFSDKDHDEKVSDLDVGDKQHFNFLQRVQNKAEKEIQQEQLNREDPKNMDNLRKAEDDAAQAVKQPDVEWLWKD